MSVSISYPGASAAVVADTVAAPIEQQVNGIDGMLYMSSQMGNDGSYTLTVTFDIGTDVNTALVMVQNRVALAMPLLPTQVQNQGITIRKRTPDMLMIVNFFSPDGRYDDIYLSNFATINVKDELLRVYGVSDVNYMGQRDYSIRAWLDPQKLAARSMTAMDVANAIRHAEPGRARRADRSAARLRGAAVPVAGRHAGPALPIRSSSATSSSRSAPGQRPRAGDRHRPPPRCGPRRAGRPELQPVLHLRRPSRRWASASISSPAPMRSTSPTACGPRWRSSRSASRTASTTTSPTTRRRSSASRSARSSRPCATPSSWSASSCWSSSRTGGR